jgi:hypothetical protein
VLEVLSDGRGPMPAVVRLGLDDAFVSGYGTHAEALAAARLSATGLEHSARQWLAKCGPTRRGATGCEVHLTVSGFG